MRGLGAALCCLLALGAPGWANAPDNSPRPLLRPGAVAPVPAAPSRVAVDINLRPIASDGAPGTSPLPRVAPRAEVRAQPARPAARTEVPRAISRAGSVCRDRRIRGEQLAAIAGTLPGCGVAQPVRVSEVDGVTLSTPAIMDCGTADALKDWVQGSVKPTIGRLGGGVASLRVAAHYTCRARNNQAGAPISEHGKGKAIDISAITLQNGVVIDVESGWRDPVAGQLLRKVHDEACGPFQTVLGPDADRFHQDHLHLETADRRGRFCR